MEAEGEPVDEPAELAHFHPLITIAPQPRPGHPGRPPGR
ncbi:hypothetical protein ACFWJ4_23585 [Kitasatospora sp. NPDC127067]